MVVRTKDFRVMSFGMRQRPPQAAVWYSAQLRMQATNATEATYSLLSDTSSSEASPSLSAYSAACVRLATCSLPKI